jgi:hypothetical protein
VRLRITTPTTALTITLIVAGSVLAVASVAGFGFWLSETSRATAHGPSPSTSASPAVPLTEAIAKDIIDRYQHDAVTQLPGATVQPAVGLLDYCNGLSSPVISYSEQHLLTWSQPPDYRAVVQHLADHWHALHYQVITDHHTDSTRPEVSVQNPTDQFNLAISVHHGIETTVTLAISSPCFKDA